MSKYILTPEHKKKLLLANLGGNKGAFKKGIIPWNKGKGKKYEIRKCIICGKGFTNINLPVKTCSKECGITYFLQTQLKRRKRVKLTCIVCKKEFETQPCWAKKDKTYCCSNKCKRSMRIRYPKYIKVKAARLVQLLMEQGSIKKQPCEICGTLKDIIAHHHKGYKKENWLDVKWFCRKHHSEEHARIRRSGEYKLL